MKWNAKFRKDLKCVSGNRAASFLKISSGFLPF